MNQKFLSKSSWSIRGGGGGSNNDIKIMLREHDHTVECISWAPNTANKSISEAFEEVIFSREILKH